MRKPLSKNHRSPVYVIAWSYGYGDLKGYADADGNVDWGRFTSENSFARAAYTRKQEFLDAGYKESDIDVQRIDSLDDLKKTWDMWVGYGEVHGLDFFSHAPNTSALITLYLSIEKWFFPKLIEISIQYFSFK